MQSRAMREWELLDRYTEIVKSIERISDTEEEALYWQIKNNQFADDARKRLILGNLWQVIFRINKWPMIANLSGRDDIIGAGLDALVSCAGRFEGTGGKFNAYAYLYIKGWIYRAVKEELKLNKFNVSSIMTIEDSNEREYDDDYIDAFDYMQIQNVENPEEYADRMLLRNRLIKCIKRVAGDGQQKAERMIKEFGLDGTCTTRVELIKRMGGTRQNASYKIRSLLAKLRKDEEIQHLYNTYIRGE